MAAKAAESHSHENNDTKGSELGWQCISLAVELGVKRHVMFHLHSHARSNPHKLASFGRSHGRLSFILVQANARAILARSLQVTADIDAINY